MHSMMLRALLILVVLAGMRVAHAQADLSLIAYADCGVNAQPGTCLVTRVTLATQEVTVLPGGGFRIFGQVVTESESESSNFFNEVTMTYSIPAGVTFVGRDPLDESPDVCTTPPAGASGTITCSRGVAGQNVNYMLFP